MLFSASPERQGGPGMYSAQYNVPWCFVWVSVLLVAVLVQSLIFMKKAWQHGLSIGLSEVQLRKGLTTGLTISIMPTLPVLIVFLSLMPLLGSPLSWLRLSVVGSAHYETYAASTAMQSLGQELVPGGYSLNGWIAAAWVMTVGGSASVLWSALMIKPISTLYQKAEKFFNMDVITTIGAGFLAGIMAFVSVVYGLSAIDTKGVIFGISFICGGIIVFIYKKYPNLKWMSDYLMAISMIIAMGFACLIF